MIPGTSRRLLIPPRTGDSIIINSSRISRNYRTPTPIPRPRFFTMSQANGEQNGYKRVLSVDNINPAVVSAKYAVRGELAIRANALTEELNRGGSNLPFKDVVHCEIGNPQALDQKPLSFIRQVSPVR